MADNTPETLYRLYMEVLGRGLYTPGILIKRIARTIEEAGHVAALVNSLGFRKLSPEACAIAIAYLKQPMYAKDRPAA